MGRKRIRLTSIAYLLYDWLCLYGGGASSDVNLQEFCGWAAEHTGVTHTTKQIRDAVNELEGHGLVEVESLRLKPNEMYLERFHPGV